MIFSFYSKVYRRTEVMVNSLNTINKNTQFTFETHIDNTINFLDNKFNFNIYRKTNTN